MGLLFTLGLAALVLVFVLGVVGLVLIKLGVIARNAMKDEPAQHGDYGLSQSRQIGEE